MPGRSVVVLVVAAALALATGCSSGGTTDSGAGTTTVVGSDAGGSVVPGTVPSGAEAAVPIVDPASVEAFCALDRQLDQLTAEQLDADVDDAVAFRADLAAFVTDNTTVIDQYVAAAPAEIRDDVNASMAQTRAAVDDEALFATLLDGTGDRRSSDRVSAFIDANCPA